MRHYVSTDAKRTRRKKWQLVEKEVELAYHRPPIGSIYAHEGVIHCAKHEMPLDCRGETSDRSGASYYCPSCLETIYVPFVVAEFVSSR